jgi:segregation and condensation protein A
MQEESYTVKLDDVFEGPMDLLIHLIRKNEVDIYDIPIALITRQYLEYISWLKAMNIDIAGDFLVMAATLAQIKSKTLLPANEYDDDEDDPRSEIARPLAEYLQMKSVAEELANRDILGDSTFVRMPDHKDFSYDPNDPVIKMGLFELIDAFQKILDNMPGEHRVDFSTDRISVKDRISEIIDVLEEKGSVTFEELFPKDVNKSEVIITFLAILEMVKLMLIRVAQHVQTGIIRLFYL